MLRSLVLACCALGSACKVVHSTAGADGATGGPSVGFVADETRVLESDAEIVLVVSLNEPSSEEVVVYYEQREGSASVGEDYIVPSSAVVFGPGVTTGSIPVLIFADALDEGEEDFGVTLTGAQGAVLDVTGFDRTQHIVTIVSNQVPRVSFEVSGSVADEALDIPVDVVLSQPAVTLVSAFYNIGGSATADDYSPLSGEVRFPPGSDREVILINKNHDTKDEPDESIVLSIFGAANATLGPVSTHVHTIRDDDPPPMVRFFLGMQNVAEGNTGETMISAQVVLSAASAFPITVPFTVDVTGTAMNPADFHVVTTSPLTFAPNALSVSIVVAITGDTVVEGSETIKLQLGTPTSASLGTPQLHTITIVDDD